MVEIWGKFKRKQSYRWRQVPAILWWLIYQWTNTLNVISCLFLVDISLSITANWTSLCVSTMICSYFEILQMQGDCICVHAAAHVLHCAALFPSLVISQPNTAFTFFTSSEPKSLMRRPISANTSSLFSPPPCAGVQTTHLGCKMENMCHEFECGKGAFSLWRTSCATCCGEASAAAACRST